MDKQIWIKAGMWDCEALTAAPVGGVTLLKASTMQYMILPRSVRGKP